MFPMISNFFSKFFNNSQICKDEDIEFQIKLFLKALVDRISFDHAIVALLNTFTLVVRKSHSIDKEAL